MTNIVQRDLSSWRHLHHGADFAGREAADRLVEHDEPRPHHQPHRELQPALLEQREAAGHGVEPAVEFEPLQELDPLGRFERVRGIFQHQHRGLQIVAHRELGEQPHRLKVRASPASATSCGRTPVMSEPGEIDLAAVETQARRSRH